MIKNAVRWHFATDVLVEFSHYSLIWNSTVLFYFYLFYFIFVFFSKPKY